MTTNKQKIVLWRGQVLAVATAEAKSELPSELSQLTPMIIRGSFPASQVPKMNLGRREWMFCEDSASSLVVKGGAWRKLEKVGAGLVNAQSGPLDCRPHPCY